MSEDVPPLLDFLSRRRTQARAASAPYVAVVATPDTMLYWLAEACQRARKHGGRKQVHVAASADVDQSTIARFEKARSAWPKDPDQFIRAYADDLDIDPIQLWQTAIALWQNHVRGDGAAVSRDATAQKIGRGVKAGADSARTQRARRAPAGTRAAKAKKPASG